MHVCTSQLVLPIVFIVHLFNIVFHYFFIIHMDYCLKQKKILLDVLN